MLPWFMCSVFDGITERSDIELVRDIHKDKKKELMMKFLLQYCNEIGVTLIAEVKYQVVIKIMEKNNCCCSQYL